MQHLYTPHSAAFAHKNSVSSAKVTAHATADPGIHPRAGQEWEGDQIRNVIHNQGAARGRRWVLPSPGRAAVRGCCSTLPRCQGGTEVLHVDPHERWLQDNCSLRTRSPLAAPEDPPEARRRLHGPRHVCGCRWKDNMGHTESIPPAHPVFQALLQLSVKRLHQWDFLMFLEEVVLLLKALVSLPTSFPSYLTYIFPPKSSFPSIIP